MTDKVQEIQKRVEASRDDIIKFMREICAIPSMELQIGPVGERIQAEMKKLGYDEVRFDKMGNTIGRIGTGKKVIVFDLHIDTVGVGDPSEWGMYCLSEKWKTVFSTRAVPVMKRTVHRAWSMGWPLRVTWVCWTAGPLIISVIWKNGVTASPPIYFSWKLTQISNQILLSSVSRPR